MKNLFLYVGIILVLTNCQQSPTDNSSQSTEQTPSEKAKITTTDFDSIFAAHQVYGTFVLYDLAENRMYVHNEARADSGFVPASTFKIPNSLICLEEGTISDENEIIPWDGIERMSPSWNQDQNLRTAFKRSAYWFYQILARRVGEERMQYWLDTMQYGNQNMGGGLDQFWLMGDIRISAKEQIAFLKKLQDNSLSFSQRTKDIVRDIMIREKTDEFTLRAKTGWGIPANRPAVGWYVGYLETQETVYFFAMNMHMPGIEDAPKRILITKDVFKVIGIEIEG